MSRMSDLRARRRRLLARCELQRADLAQRLGEFKDSPLTRVAGEMFGAEGGKGLPLLSGSEPEPVNSRAPLPVG